MASMSRRKFLAVSLGLAGSLVLGSLIGKDRVIGALVGRATDASELTSQHLPYEPIKPEVVRERGYINYFKHYHCGEGAFKAIVETLAEAIGGPWANIPTYVVYWGHGGGVGFGGTCGALIGAASAIMLAFGRTKLADKLVYELFRWYELTPFPTWTPPDELVEKYGKVKGPLPTSVSYSILCHISVTRWCLAAKKASGSPERSERCARLTGEVAAKAVELMNAAVQGKFKPIVVDPLVADTEYGCRKCHRKGADYAVGGWTRGKMDCTICHPAPHLKILPRIGTS